MGNATNSDGMPASLPGREGKPRSRILFRNGTVLTGFAAMESCDVLLEDGIVAEVFGERRLSQHTLDPGTTVLDAGGAYIAPGFIDTHIHGFSGYGTEGGDPEELAGMSRSLARYGVTSFCPTFYPAERGSLVAQMRSASRAVVPEDGSRILGFHLEGPFISPERLGVQRPETVSPVDMGFMEELWEASGGRIASMTIAPELKGMRELALYCLKKGIVLQAGHTNATYENMLEGMQAGVLHATHLFNGMSQMHHRNPNAVGAVLIHPELTCEIIADGRHIHPDLIRLVTREKPLDRIVLVTDSLRPTEQKEGPLVANGEEVYLKDGLFYRRSDDTIAGSCLTMMEGVRNLVSFGISVQDAVSMASGNPARVLRVPRLGALIPGYEGDITVFDKQFRVSAVAVRGRLVKNEL